MFEMTWSVVGFIAGFLTTIGFLPQAIKSYRTKRLDDVSLRQPVVLLFGMLLWLAYGIHLHNWAIILANVFSILLNGFIIILKIKYDSKRNEGGNA